MIKKVIKFCVIVLIGLFFTAYPICFSAFAQEAAASNGENSNTENKSSYSVKPESAQKFLSENKLLSGTKKVEGKYDCYTSSSGEKYCIKTSDKKGSEYAKDATLYSNSNGVKGCPVVAVEWYKNQNCTFCSLISLVYKASDVVSSKSFEKFATSFASLIVIVLVIWLAFKTLGYVSFLVVQDAAKYLSEILIQAFKFLLAFYALYNYKELYDWFIIPLLNFGLDFATEFVDVDIGEENYTMLQKDTAGKYIEHVEAIRNNKLYNFNTYLRLQKFALDVNMQFSLLQSIGGSLRCLGNKYMFTSFGNLGWGAGFGLGFCCLIYSIMYSVMGFLLSMAFVFYLLDAVVQMGIFGAIIPFAVACWPFKMFTKSATNAFKIFMNSVFTFVMAGVVVKICMLLLSNAMGPAGEGKRDNISVLVMAMDTADTDTLKPMIGSINIQMLVFIFACLSGFMLVGKVGALTDKFAQGGISPIAPSLATNAASGVKGMGQKVAGPTLKRLGQDANKAAKGVIKAPFKLAGWGIKTGAEKIKTKKQSRRGE